MSDHLATRYVNLTESIAVPEEWPVQVLREFLVPLVEQVIDAAYPHESVVLQVLNLPAKLVQRQDQNGKRYFFEKVFSEELVGSYVIDVIVNTNDKNIQLNDVATSGIAFPNALVRRVSLDEYQVHVHQSEYRTAYYLIPAAQTVTTLMPVQTKQLRSSQREKPKERQTECDVMYLLAAVVIPHLLFLIYLIETYGN